MDNKKVCIYKCIYSNTNINVYTAIHILYICLAGLQFINHRTCFQLTPSKNQKKTTKLNFHTKAYHSRFSMVFYDLL